jgi:hypothetical protein
MQACALSVVYDGKTVTVRGIAAQIIRRILDPSLRADLERPGQARQVVFHVQEGRQIDAHIKRFYPEDS